MKVKLAHAHPWDVLPREAIAIQEQLRRYVIQTDQFGEIHTVAGVDVGFEDNGRVTRAAVVTLQFPSLQPLETAVARQPTRFPYVPGLLSFRELPAVLAAMQQLRQPADIYLCDGQGYAHPRRLGIASHLGVLTGFATIGVGKSRLLGSHAAVADRRGAWQPLMDRDEVVGAVLRSRQGVKPIYVSCGHRVCLDSAVRLVLACTTRYKLPETTRLARKYASNA